MGRKGTRSRNPKKRKRPARARGGEIGLLSPDALLAHRELEFLRDASRAGSGKISNRGRRSLEIRAEKLEEARRVAKKYGSGSSTTTTEQE